MRNSLRALVASCALLLAPAPQAQTTAITDARVIVKYKADSPLLGDPTLATAAKRADRARALGARVGLELIAGSGVSRRAHVVFAHGMTSEQLAQRLARESDIEYAVPDQRRRISTAPNDPLYLSGPPVLAGAGRSVRSTRAPVCKPTPVVLICDLSVRCFSMARALLRIA